MVRCYAIAYGCHCRCRFETQTAQTVVTFAVFEIDSFLVPLPRHLKVDGHACAQTVPAPQVRHGGGVLGVGDVGDGLQGLVKKRRTRGPVPVFLSQLQRLFLMRLEAHGGLHITQIIVRIFTALQAVPHHGVNVLKRVGLAHLSLLHTHTLPYPRLAK